MTPRARLGLSAAVACVLLTACTTPSRQPDMRPVIRVASAGALDFEDLPAALAHADLAARGYRVEETSYATSELAVDALARGMADVSTGAVVSAWAAARRGAPVRTVMEHVRTHLTLVTTREIADCAGLHGRRLALQGEGGASTAMTRAFLAEECPDATPLVLVLPDSGHRAAALLAGGADGAVLQLPVFDWLDEQAPRRFHLIASFADRWPWLLTTGVHVNTGFAAAHPASAAAYLEARLLVNRSIRADPGRLAAEAARALGPSPRWTRLAMRYAEAGAWAADGGLSRENVAATAAFFGGGAAAQPAVETLADLTFLRAALGLLAQDRR